MYRVRMNVLSLFNGNGTGLHALKQQGVKVENYFVSEVDKYANIINFKNHPESIQLGDVRKVCGILDVPKIDLLIGGSPCQGFSFAGKQLDFDDPRSALFFEYVRVLEELRLLNPGVKFLLENVRMKKESKDVITSYLGVEPIEINSALVSAQSRKRLYWTNIEGVTQPEDRGILLRDIVQELGNERAVGVTAKNQAKEISDFDTDKATCLLARDYKGFGNQARTGIFQDLESYIVPFDRTLQILDKEVQRGKVGYFRKDSQANRVYYIHNKAVTLTGDSGGGAAKMGMYLFGDTKVFAARDISRGDKISESSGQMFNGSDKAYCLTTNCWHQGLLFGVITPDRVEKRQNVQRFSEGKKFYTLTAQDKHGVLVEGYIRKLTPIECERLQTLPDNYSEGVSNSQRYKMLGNGWTSDVIQHIFSFLKTQ